MYSILVYKRCLFLTLAVSNYGQSIGWYLQVSPRKNFDDAISECQGRGMQLAILNSQAAYDAAVSYIESINKGLDEIWIGFRIKDVSTHEFEWINGETTQFSKWKPDQPNYFEPDSFAKLRIVSSVYMFADRESKEKYAFLCGDVDDVITTTETVYTTTEAVATTTEPVETTTEAVDTTTEPVDTSTEAVDTTTEPVETTTEAVDTTTERVHTTTEAKGSVEVCQCGCGSINFVNDYHNYTFEELKKILSPITDHLRRELLVDKTTLSAYTNKRKSKEDDRPSARRIGYGGITCLIIVVVLVIFADMSSLCKN